MNSLSLWQLKTGSKKDYGLSKYFLVLIFILSSCSMSGEIISTSLAPKPGIDSGNGDGNGEDDSSVPILDSFESAAIGNLPSGWIYANAPCGGSCPAPPATSNSFFSEGLKSVEFFADIDGDGGMYRTIDFTGKTKVIFDVTQIGTCYDFMSQPKGPYAISVMISGTSYTLTIASPVANATLNFSGVSGQKDLLFYGVQLDFNCYGTHIDNLRIQ